MWHPSPEPLLTLSSQAFPTELKRNPSIYLPTMNRLAFDSSIGREADEYTARYDCSVSFRFRRSWHMFLEDCCLQVDTTSSLVQSSWVGLQVKDLPLRWPSRFYHLVRIISGRRCCLVTLVTMSELSNRQLCYNAEVVVSSVLTISAWPVTMSSCQSRCLISSIAVSGLGRQAMNQNM